MNSNYTGNVKDSDVLALFTMLHVCCRVSSVSWNYGGVDYLVLQGELCVMVLPECAWSQEHLHTHPGSRQW